MRSAWVTFLFVIGLTSLLFCPDSFAAEKKKRELPQSGVLAGSMTSGYGSTNVDGVWGGDTGMSDGGGSPVSGSISRLDPTTWLLKVFNNSEDKYRVNLQVVQVGKNNKTIKTDSFLYNLKGQQSVERKIRGHSLATNANVVLKNWKKEEKAATKGEVAAEIAATKKKLEELENQLKGMGE